MNALDEVLRTLEAWEKEMTERWEQAEQDRGDAKKRSDFYYARMIAARNQLASLGSLRDLMTNEGGAA